MTLRRALVAAVIVPVIAIGSAVPAAHAEPAAPPAPTVPVVDLPDSAGSHLSAVDPAWRIETTRTSRPVAPGVTLSSFDWYEPGDSGGWVRADTLAVDLNSGTTVDYLHPGTVSSAEPLSAQATRTRAVAAVNGDFFDINNSNAPQGVAVHNGQLVKSAQAGHNRAVGIDAAGVGRVMEVFFSGTVTLPGATAPLSQLNSARIEANGIGVFNSLWGGYARSRAVEGSPRVVEIVVRRDVVTEVRQAAGGDPIPGDGYVLVGRESGADALAGLKIGDPVTVTYANRTGDGSIPRAAIGGNQLLVKDGQIVAPADPLHPRTAVGFSSDGKKMFLLTVDGRQAPYLLGLNLRDLAAMLKEMGAHNALNLDGGGSSTMLAREPGTSEVRVENTPSDGGERPVPNGLALYAPVGSGVAQGFWVRTAADPSTAPGNSTVPGGRPDRVFPELRRHLIANPYDETFGPATPGPKRWTTTPAYTGRVDADGMFHASRPGAAKVTARRGAVTGEITLTVLDPLARLGSTTNRLSLPAQGAAGSFGVVGYDRNGTSAPIEPVDTALDYDRELIDVTPSPSGTFTVTGKRPSGATTITAKVAQQVVHIPVTVGLEERAIASFEDGAAWTFGSARATGSVTPVPEGRTGPGLKLAYDFTQSTGTRTAYAIPPAPIKIEGQPLALGTWVYGHGRGEWTAFTVTDAQGQTRSLYGPYITWTGWRYLEVPVPNAMAFPIQVNRFYTIETKADRQYTGEVLIDEMVAKVPPSVVLPPEQRLADPVVVQDGTVDGKQWRFAVMSDAQFVARDPDSPLVRSARRTLRELKAQRPDFVVINGDFVDEAAPADLALARRILTEELGDELRWYYVPGNHEIMGPGTIENFKREFGATNRTFDHKGTRFVLLDSSTGTIRGGGFDQMTMLRDALDGARADGAVRSVVVLEHHPPRDPTPAKGSQLSDRLEAATVERWLAEFQSQSGKGAAFIGAHVGIFHASRVDGVPYLINGNSGKTPAGDTGHGGFSGWTMVGVEHLPGRPRPQWITAEIRPHVDALTLTVPPTIPVGTQGKVTAELLQGTRRVPVAYPVSADWSGSLNLHIGPPHGIRPWHVAALDPATGALRALREGTVTIAVTVNGVMRSTQVNVTTAALRATG
ncbi:calcineurin-like phosphoesterase family protein [Herbihabitans rhizosphaerae]|uniref:Calcineurin-like phosphoesterase family protein n=1 Tax=Herbihabitans rhizosphaerae TaxID=1872711 RepID=A0A4Q7KKE3_9PSEU|nr:phosphodiester glycosidase family protein [Herbihabitans rhizosphaerae]RZS36340.1 calcineurin-like phosphoesterase family protein [Herbihabitans rhizosphaerae]